MKYLKYTRLLCMALLAMGFTACNDEAAYFEEDAQNSPIVVNKLYLPRSDVCTARTSHPSVRKRTVWSEKSVYQRI